MEQLRDDFPDVSVSKIRFLESQGLINPGRTPSGYRQFSEDDLNLLRWILRQQRENYLPLKVIRRRLRDGLGPEAESHDPESVPAGEGEAAAPLEHEAVGVASPMEQLSSPRLPLSGEPEPAMPAEGPAAEGVSGSADELWPPGARDATYSQVDLARETGLDDGALSELEAFGLLPRSAGGDFDEDARQVADIAARFFGYGVEARHLRMYKSFAEREATFLQQVVMPMLNARHRRSRAPAREALGELARLGQALRLSMLRAALGPPPRE